MPKLGSHFTKRKKFRRRCRFCKSEFMAADVKASICSMCLLRSHLCACGCGQIVYGAWRSYVQYHAAHDKHNINVRNGHKRQGRKVKGSRNPSRRKEVREQISKSVVASWRRPDVWKRHAASIRLALSRPEVKLKLSKLAAWRNANLSHPNKQERRLSYLLRQLFPGQFRMNVCGGLVIGRKVPDFINVDGRKMVVELFGDYWHSYKITGRHPAREERKRKRHFSRYGFRTCIIWGSELSDKRKIRHKVVKVMEECDANLEKI